MKKKMLVLSIISTVLAVAGLVLAFVAFKTSGSSAIIGTFQGLVDFKGLIAAKDWIGVAIDAIALVLTILIVVYWIIHLVKLIVKKAKQWIAVNVLGFVGGLLGVYVMGAELVKHGFVEYASVAHPGVYAHNLIDAIFSNQWNKWFSPVFEDHHGIYAILGLLAVAFGLAAWIIGFKTLVTSLRVMEGKVAEDGKKADEANEEVNAVSEKDGEGAPTSEDELRGAEDAELADDDEGKKVGPYVVQYFNYGPAAKPAEEPQKAEEPAEDEEMLTSDDLRKIIREEMHLDPNAPTQKSLTEDQIRQIVKEEIEKAVNPLHTNAEQQQNTAIKQLQDNQLTTEQIRTVVAQELDKRHYAPAEKPVEPKKEEVKPAPAEKPAPVVVQVIAAPAPAPIPAPVPAPAPVEAAPVEEKKKIVRVPFPERLDAADKDVKANYNEIKAEALSFGLKSRLSNSGDTFRLHTKTYLKITVAGKGLKIYYALDPKAYENSPIPVKDVSSKNIYKEIPGCFKVKSALSVKRAKQLIADACEKDNLEQGKAEIKNYAAEMKDYKPQVGDDDDGDDGDDDDK